MNTQASKNLQAKSKVILAQERAWALALGRSMRDPRPISAWEVIMPLLLIFNYARAKADRELFAQNFLFTKDLALKAAVAMARDNRPRADIGRVIEEKTAGLLKTTPDDVYSELVRTAQLKEMDVLMDHYGRLLRAEGRDYAALATMAYGGRREYEEFLTRLKAAEADVNQASLETVGPKGDPRFVAKLENNIERLRVNTIQRIFGERG